MDLDNLASNIKPQTCTRKSFGSYDRGVPITYNDVNNAIYLFYKRKLIYQIYPRSLVYDHDCSAVVVLCNPNPGIGNVRAHSI